MKINSPSVHVVWIVVGIWNTPQAWSQWTIQGGHGTQTVPSRALPWDFLGKLWAQVLAVAFLRLAEKASPREWDLSNLRSLFSTWHQSSPTPTHKIFYQCLDWCLNRCTDFFFFPANFANFPYNFHLVDCLCCGVSFTVLTIGSSPLVCLSVWIYFQWYLSKHFHSHLGSVIHQNTTTGIIQM